MVDPSSMTRARNSRHVMMEGGMVDPAEMLRSKVGKYMDGRAADLSLCVERTERFAADVAPIMDALKELADAGACDRDGRPLGWELVPVGPEGADDYSQTAYYTAFGGQDAFHFRPCCLKVGFWSVGGNLENIGCVVTRCAERAGHSAGQKERTTIGFLDDGATASSFRRAWGEPSARLVGVAGYCDWRSADWRFAERRPKLRIFEVGNSSCGLLKEWVIRAAVEGTDPAMSTTAEARQELADSRAVVMVRLAEVAAASTAGRPVREVREAVAEMDEAFPAVADSNSHPMLAAFRSGSNFGTKGDSQGEESLIQSVVWSGLRRT